MSLPIARVAESFSRHDFEVAYPYLAEDVRWTIIGGEVIVGRVAVIDVCDGSAAHLTTVETTFRKFRAMEGADFVVIDSEAAYTGADGTTVVASCDIYSFEDGRIRGITSYTVEVG
jgi:ketosteroid isomerase-like protein